MSFIIELTPVEISIRSIIYQLESWYCEGKDFEICPVHKTIYLYKHSELVHNIRRYQYSMKQTSISEAWLFLSEIGQYKFRDFWFVIHKHDPLGTVAFSYEALLNETYYEVTQTPKHRLDFFGQSPLLGIGGSNVGTQSPDWTRFVIFRSRPWWNSAGRRNVEIYIWSLITVPMRRE